MSRMIVTQWSPLKSCGIDDLGQSNVTLTHSATCVSSFNESPTFFKRSGSTLCEPWRRCAQMRYWQKSTFSYRKPFGASAWINWPMRSIWVLASHSWLKNLAKYSALHSSRSSILPFQGIWLISSNRTSSLCWARASLAHFHSLICVRIIFHCSQYESTYNGNLQLGLPFRWTDTDLYSFFSNAVANKPCMASVPG